MPAGWPAWDTFTADEWFTFTADGWNNFDACNDPPGSLSLLGVGV